MQAQRPGQGQPFGVPALADQVVHVVAVADGDRGLLNDRAAIEFLGHVVGGGSDQLDPPLPGAVIRLGTLESGQKRVVDVDHRRRRQQEGRAQHLHVLGQHHQVDLQLAQQLPLGLLHLLAAGGIDRQMHEAGAEIGGERLQIRMVGHHQRHLHRQLTGSGAPEQIHQAMVLAAHEDRHAWVAVGEAQRSFSSQPLGQGQRRRADRLPRQAEALHLPLQPAEKQAGAGIGVVIGMTDIAAIGCHPARKGAHQPGTVGADHLKDRRGEGHHRRVGQGHCAARPGGPGLPSGPMVRLTATTLQERT